MVFRLMDLVMPLILPLQLFFFRHRPQSRSSTYYQNHPPYIKLHPIPYSTGFLASIARDLSRVSSIYPSFRLLPSCTPELSSNADRVTSI